MAKERFSREQNETLGKTKNLNGKFALLELWLKKGEISRQLYNSQINKLINRAMKAAKPSFDFDDKLNCKIAVEGEIQQFLERLRMNLNSYLSERDEAKVKLSPSDMYLFKQYIYDFPHLKSKINRLLIVGLRYPDVELNHIAEEYIKTHRLIERINYADTSFWLMLWEDGNLVPLNAVRLMLKQTENGYILNPCFNKYLILELIPLVKFQRDKEALRLSWATSLSDPAKRIVEVERKQKRLDAFNCLLEILQKK